MAELPFQERIVFPFTLLFAAFVLTAMAIGLNFRIVRQHKRVAIQWLESQGNRVEKAEWVIYPVLFSWRRHSDFEMKFIDPRGARHHAFIAVPGIGDPWFLEDKTIAS